MHVHVVHLSDIHFRVESNEVADRAKAVAGAIHANVGNRTPVVVAVTGDIAQSGRRDEYQVAINFLRTINACLLREDVSAHFLLVPGNHDCDFTKSDSLRSMVLNNPSKSPDATMIEKCLEPQSAFRAFCHELATSIPVSYVKSICETVSFEVASVQVECVLINTAWESTRPENSSHFGIPSDFTNDVSPASSARLTLALMHHPFGWMTPDRSRELRTRLERKCDLILTGHEHVPDTYLKSRGVEDKSIYCEGAAFQSDGESSFLIHHCDLVTHSIATKRLTWATDHYLVDSSMVVQLALRDRLRVRSQFPLASTAEDSLNDLGTALLHPRLKRVLLRDLFVWPDLEMVVAAASSAATPSSADVPTKRNRMKNFKHQDKATPPPTDPAILLRGEELVQTLFQHRRVLITGPEQGGKTTLAKRVTWDLLGQGRVPLLIDGGEDAPRTIDEVRQWMSRFAGEMYGENPVELFWQLPRDERVLIVDDFDELKLNEEGRDAVLSFAEDKFGSVLLLGTAGLLIQELLVQTDHPILGRYRHYSLLEMGLARRFELVYRWCALGRDLSESNKDTYKEALRQDQIITRVLTGNIIPSFPGVVVLLIQQLESFTPALSVQGSYGHLYESVIKLNLSKVAKNASDLESKLNYLTELAHEMFDRGHDGLDQSDFESWHERYQSEFASGVDRNAVLHDLSKASVLEYRHSTVRFCHPHVHNFFAARYLAQHISNGETRRKVDELCATLHTRDSANIMMLLCHFSRDQYLIKAILRVADSLFADVPQFDVGTVPELLPLSNESLEIVLQLETERPPQSRTAMLRQADEIGRKLGESHAVSKGAAEMPDGEFAAIQDFVARFNSAQKTIQIAGQILCNYYGSMKAENQRAIARSCYSLGMRSLKALLGTLEENRSVVFETIAEGLRVRSPGISQQDLMTQVGEAIFVIGHCVTLGHFMHVSDSVGLEKLKVTLDRVVKESPTLSVRMIDVAIRLDHFDDFPQKSVSDLAELLHDNHFAFGVLRHLVWRRFRLFYEDRELTQSMCAKLNIKSPSHLFINPNTKTSEAEGRRAKLRRLPRPKK